MSPFWERGKRRARREEESARQERVEKMARAADLWLTVMKMRDAGLLDMIRDPSITENSAIATLGDVVAEWPRVAALAWRGYEHLGRGFVWLDVNTGGFGFSSRGEVVNQGVQGEPIMYCDMYDPSADVLIVLTGFPEVEDDAACAFVWLRSHDSLLSPPEAWRHFDASVQERMDSNLARQANR